MSSKTKATLRCVGLKPFCSGSLRCFVDIEFCDLRMVVHGIAVHTRDGSSKASPPAQAWVKNGDTVKGDQGKAIYAPPLLEFIGPGVRKA